MVAEQTDLTFAETIYQLLETFEEAFRDEYVLNQKELDNILQVFIQKLPLSTQKMLQSGT